MRWTIAVAGVSVLVGGCGKAQALVPDPTNPAHCIAAFNWGAYWFNLSSPEHVPERQKVAEMLAHARYELDKVKASGGSVEGARKQGAELTKLYADDGDKLTLLMRDCSLAQANDPEFRRQWPSLVSWAQSEAARYPIQR